MNNSLINNSIVTNDLFQRIFSLLNMKINFNNESTEQNEQLDFKFKKSLIWLINNYPQNLLLPYVYPTNDGNLSLEWDINVFDNIKQLTVELNVQNQTYNWYYDDVYGETLDLNYVFTSSSDVFKYIKN